MYVEDGPPDTCIWRPDAIVDDRAPATGNSRDGCNVCAIRADHKPFAGRDLDGLIQRWASVSVEDDSELPGSLGHVGQPSRRTKPRRRDQLIGWTRDAIDDHVVVLRAPRREGDVGAVRTEVGRTRELVPGVTDWRAIDDGPTRGPEPAEDAGSPVDRQVGDPPGVWTELDVPPQVRVIDALVTVDNDGEATAGTIGRVGHTTRIRTEYGRADLLERGTPPVVDNRRDSPVDSSDIREPQAVGAERRRVRIDDRRTRDPVDHGPELTTVDEPVREPASVTELDSVATRRDAVGLDDRDPVDDEPLTVPDS